MKEMRQIKLAVFLVMFAFVSLSGKIQAQTIHNLESENIQANLESVDNVMLKDFLADAKMIRTFEINPILQNASGVSVEDIVVLQLFNNKNYTAKITEMTTDINGNFTLTLKLPDYPMAFGYITTSTEGKSLFFVWIPELDQKFTSRGHIHAQIDFLIELDDNELESEEKEIPIETYEEVSPANDNINDSGNQSFKKKQLKDGQLPEKEGDDVPCTRDTNLTGSDPVVINLLMVYTPAAEAWAISNGGGINNIIAGAMAQTKAVVDNQGNGDTIKLVHSALVNYTEVTNDNMSTDLDRLTETSDGYLDTVHLLRKQYNADVVALVESYSSVGGLGWVLMDSISGRYQNAFNVVRVQQISTGTTSIHEIGHNMGMRHEIDQYTTPPTPLYPYAWGWYWTGNNSTVYGSVMSYTGTRVPYFSNPNIIHQGQPAGTPTANNAQVFRNTKHVVAHYKEIINNLPAAPKNIVVSVPTNNGATVSWDSCDNAVSYRVYLSTGTTSYTFWSTTNTSYALNSTSRFQPCSTYTIWVSSINACGSVVDGQKMTFTTKCATDPTVTTTTASGITHNSATLSKTVTTNGAAVTSQGFRYKEVNADVWQTVVTSNQTSNLTGLTPNTQYKFYAYAITASDTFNSLVRTFTTLAPCNAVTYNYSASVCQGASYSDVNFTNLTQDGVYRDTLPGVTVNACDSIIVLTLSFYANIPPTPYSANICQGETYTDNSFSGLTQVGVYRDTLQTINGCDSIIVLTLSYYPNVPLTPYSANICQGGTYTDNNFNGLTQAGTYYDTLINVNGCDSIIEFNLIVNPVYFTQISESIIEGETYNFFSQSLTTTGIYYDTLSTIHGCDSIFELTLTVSYAFIFNYSVAVCDGDSYSDNNFSNLTQAGIYYDTLSGAGGNDTIFKLTLTVNPLPPKPTINLNNNILTSSTANSYQWYYNNTLISGATQQTYACTQSGEYAVEITNEYGCTSKSDNITYTIVSIEDIEHNETLIHVYPNPTNGELTMDNGQLTIENIEIFDVLGRMQPINNSPFERGRGMFIIDISHLSAGIYFLKIQTQSGSVTKKIIKE